MNKKPYSRQDSPAINFATLAADGHSIAAAKHLTSKGLGVDLAALQAITTPLESVRKYLETLDRFSSFREEANLSKLAEANRFAPKSIESSALKAIQGLTEQSTAAARFASFDSALLADSSALKAMQRLAEQSTAAARFASFDSALLADSSALKAMQRLTEQSTAATWLASFDSALLAGKKAFKDMLLPSTTAKNYFDELTANTKTLLATDPLKSFSIELERFKEPLDVSTTRVLLERLSKARDSFDAQNLLDETALLPEAEATREVAHLVQSATAHVSTASTTPEAVAQILRAIEEAQEPRAQRLLFVFFLPILLVFLSAVVNPIVEFHVNKLLQEAPRQETAKHVKEVAREAVGDVRLLDEFRFVSAQSLTLKSGPKAKAPAVGYLRFGQAVRVLEKERDFTLVVWRSEDGKIELQGWVFSRYLKRFD